MSSGERFAQSILASSESTFGVEVPLRSGGAGARGGGDVTGVRGGGEITGGDEVTGVREGGEVAGFRGGKATGGGGGVGALGFWLGRVLRVIGGGLILGELSDCGLLVLVEP